MGASGSVVCFTSMTSDEGEREGLKPRSLAISVWPAMSKPKASMVKDGTTCARVLMRSGCAD